MESEEADPHDLPEGTDIGVVGVPFDGGVTRQPGTRYGPEKIRRESGWYARNDGGFNAATGRRVDFGDVSIRDCGDVPLKTTDIKETGEGIRRTVRTVAESSFPVVLGGDHYLTYPSFCGVAEANGERLGMIHLDSHSDVYGSWDLHGDHWHGSPMNLINDTEYGGYETHSMVGLRAREAPDFPEFVEEEGLNVSYARDVDDRGIEACIEDAIEHATARVDSVYLTVDIDVVEPTIAPGTGTPEFGGIDATQLLTAMDRLGECADICAVDLVEVAPRLDSSRMTQRLAAAALSRFLEAKFG
ncbi:agmatinase family protein [Halobellus sp. EA9]|uniref:agmatinase family protein n=1 Tax=Halobellus sp. EA9 TaxID=3421647 RepID=UPI003EBBA374